MTNPTEYRSPFSVYHFDEMNEFLELYRPKQKNDFLSDRNEGIYMMRMNGYKYREIGELYGLTVEGCRRIYNKRCRQKRTEFMIFCKEHHNVEVHDCIKRELLNILDDIKGLV